MNEARPLEQARLHTTTNNNNKQGDFNRMEISLQTEQETHITIPEMIRELAQKRIEKEKLTAKSTELLKTVYDANPNHFKAEQDVKNDIAVLESSIKMAVISLYCADPAIGKKPFPGVGIRVSETMDVQYDQAVALEWAKSHDMCLMLDVPAFESLCKSASTRPDFVVVVLDNKVAATIDRNLSVGGE